MPAMTKTRRSRRVVATAVAAGAGLLAAAATATAQSQPPAPVLAPGVVADGVRIDGVKVGGLTRAEAVATVLQERVAPKRKRLVVSFRGKRFAVNPVSLGYRADVRYAVTAALNFGRSRPVPAQGVNVPLRESVSNKRVRALIRARARKLDVPARNASIRFSGSKPVITKARIGIAMRQSAAEARLRRAVLHTRPRVVKLPSARVRPSVTNAPPAILINRSAFKLTLYKGGRTKSFTVAVGQPGHPTPAGTFHINDKQRNPIWYPPNSPWAAGLGPVPAGVGNPLGTRWMGTSYPAIGIHGTPVPSSLGTRASHGCIRMAIPSAEWLFDQITIGTQVVIV
jgi:lipoprotein-anchoring transpeptidase ErfK/SrfK